MFSIKGELIVKMPFDFLRTVIRLIIYFSLFFYQFLCGQMFRRGRFKERVIAFTATGNTCELAIAVAIGVFGINNGQAFAGFIDPYIAADVRSVGLLNRSGNISKIHTAVIHA